MKSLDDLDELVRYCEEFPYPDLIKRLRTLRAQFVLDIAPYRELRIAEPVEEEVE